MRPRVKQLSWIIGILAYIHEDGKMLYQVDAFAQCLDGMVEFAQVLVQPDICVKEAGGAVNTLLGALIHNRDDISIPVGLTFAN